MKDYAAVGRNSEELTPERAFQMLIGGKTGYADEVGKIMAKRVFCNTALEENCTARELHSCHIAPFLKGIQY